MAVPAGMRESTDALANLTVEKSASYRNWSTRKPKAWR
jgi:hypothetical protein